jgi:hypothetical protein
MDFLEALQLNRGCILLHRTLKNYDGTPQRFRVNGMVKTWRTMPERIQVPLKRGFSQFGYLTEQNLEEFEVMMNEY